VFYYYAKKRNDIQDYNEALEDNKQIVLAKLQSDQQMQKDEQKFFKESEQRWKQHTQRVKGEIASQTTAILFQHQTLKGALTNILETETEEVISAGLKQLFAHQAVEAGKTIATVTGNQTRVAADVAGQAESLAVQGESAVKWIMTEAAKAAAGAFNALVSIPYVGPFLAVGASVAAFAAVAKLVSSVASAEGGWERVPADGMMTELHKNEMVLPAHVAEPVRQMAKNGSVGGAQNITIHAADARSFKDMLRRNPNLLADAARHGMRRGYRV
jgi:hypothetical protein